MGWTCLLGVVIVLGRVSGAVVMAPQASAEGFSSRESLIGTGGVLNSGIFRYFPVRVIVEVVVIVWKGNGDEGKLESLGEPVRGSRNLSEDFIIVGGGKREVSFDVMSSTGSDHAATFFCLDRVIIANRVRFFVWGRL